MHRLFLDTEFTDLSPRARLISLALGAEDARALYFELDGWTLDACSRFVKEFVLPQLRAGPHGRPGRRRPGAWLRGPGVSANQCEYFAPGRVPAAVLRAQERLLAAWPRHHALHDAVALRIAYQAAHGSGIGKEAAAVEALLKSSGR